MSRFKRTFERQTLVLLLLIFTAAAATFVLWRSFSGSLPFQAMKYRVSVVAANSAGVGEGTSIRIAGINAGVVAAVQRDGDVTKIVMSIDGKFAPLRRDMKVAPRVKTLVGEPYIQITPGTDKSEVVKDGDTVDVGSWRSNASLDDLYAIFDSSAKKDLNKLFSKTASALNGSGASLNQAVGDGSQVVANMADVFSVVADQRAHLRRLIDSGVEVTGSLDQSRSAITQLVSSADRVFAVTAERQRQLQSLLAKTPAFLQQAKASSELQSRLLPMLQAATDRLPQFAAQVGPVLNSAFRYSDHFERLFEQLPTVDIELEETYPKLGSVLTQTQLASQQVYPYLRELNPLLELAARYRKRIVGAYANGGSMLNGRIVGAGGRLQSYLSGPLILGGSLIGGYKRRPPTTRKNPYADPFSVLDMTAGKQLASFSCEHSNNSWPLPSLGETPECRAAGKWTSVGNTAYYPYLERAAPLDVVILWQCQLFRPANSPSNRRWFTATTVSMSSL